MGEWGDLGRLGDWAPKWVTELSRSLLRPPYGAFTASRNARPRGARRACHHAAPSAAALREGPDPGGEHRASSCAPYMCRSRRARTPPLTSGSLSMPPFTAPGQPIRPRRSPRPVRSDQDGVPRAGQDRGRRSVALRVAAGREGARDPGAAAGRSPGGPSGRTRCSTPRGTTSRARSPRARSPSASRTCAPSWSPTASAARRRRCSSATARATASRSSPSRSMRSASSARCVPLPRSRPPRRSPPTTPPSRSGAARPSASWARRSSPSAEVRRLEDLRAQARGRPRPRARGARPAARGRPRAAPPDRRGAAERGAHPHADARFVRQRPPGRGARGLPRALARGCASSACSPGEPVRALERRILEQDPALAAQQEPAAAAPLPRSGPAPVGREPQLARLRAALGIARAGRRGGVMIRGESGAGKSTLVDAFLDETQRRRRRARVRRPVPRPPRPGRAVHAGSRGARRARPRPARRRRPARARAARADLARRAARGCSTRRPTPKPSGTAPRAPRRRACCARCSRRSTRRAPPPRSCSCWRTCTGPTTPRSTCSTRSCAAASLPGCSCSARTGRPRQARASRPSPRSSTS